MSSPENDILRYWKNTDLPEGNSFLFIVLFPVVIISKKKKNIIFVPQKNISMHVFWTSEWMVVVLPGPVVF